MTDFLPCPFCGENVEPSIAEGSTYRWMVIQGCCCDIEIGKHDRALPATDPVNMASVRETWNRRPARERAEPVARLTLCEETFDLIRKTLDDAPPLSLAERTAAELEQWEDAIITVIKNVAAEHVTRAAPIAPDAPTRQHDWSNGPLSKQGEGDTASATSASSGATVGGQERLTKRDGRVALDQEPVETAAEGELRCAAEALIPFVAMTSGEFRERRDDAVERLFIAISMVIGPRT